MFTCGLLETPACAADELKSMANKVFLYTRAPAGEKPSRESEHAVDRSGVPDRRPRAQEPQRDRLGIRRDTETVGALHNCLHGRLVEL